MARDMSTTADLSAARRLFALAVQMMERQSEVQPLQNLYGFVAYWAAKNKKIPFLHDKDAAKLYDELLDKEKDCEKAGKESREEQNNGNDWGDWGDWAEESAEFVPDKKMDAAPHKMQESVWGESVKKSKKGQRGLPLAGLFFSTADGWQHRGKRG